MIVLARIPAQLTPRQTLLVVGLAIGIALAVLAGVLFESLVGGLVTIVLRLTGHKPPRRSQFSKVLDEFEERTRDR